MKLLRCRKCGATIVGVESKAQQMLDALEEANKRAQHGSTRTTRNAALAQAADIRAAYKTYMHNITNAQYAEHVTPIILQEVKKFCLVNKRLTPEEWTTLSDKGRKRAAAEQAAAEREADLVYGGLMDALDSPQKDPTFEQACRNIERERRRR